MSVRIPTGERAMNKLRVGIVAVALAFGCTSALADDNAATPLGHAKTPRDRAKQEKQEAVNAATTGAGMEQPKEKPVIGDFPPYYGGQSLKQLRAEQRRRSEREYERLEKLTPKEQDEEHAERKRRQEEWQKMRPPENNSTK